MSRKAPTSADSMREIPTPPALVRYAPVTIKGSTYVPVPPRDK
jgi:hypothetical protein